MIRAPNAARGEVALTIDGETYILAGTFGGMSRLQAALGVVGLHRTFEMIIAHDPRALYHGVLCLAVDGNTERLATAPFQPNYEEVCAKITAAMNGPEASSKKKEIGGTE